MKYKNDSTGYNIQCVNVKKKKKVDNKVKNNGPFPIYLISFSVDKLCSEEAEFKGYSNLAQSKELKGNFHVLSSLHDSS